MWQKGNDILKEQVNWGCHLYSFCKKGWDEIVDRGDQVRQKVSTIHQSEDKTSRVLQLSLPSQKRMELPALADGDILGWGSLPGAKDSSYKWTHTGFHLSPNRSGP